MSGFDFFNAVVAGFQTFKKGARLLNEVTPEEEGFATPPTVDLDTKVRPAKAPLREMEKPLCGPPKMLSENTMMKFNIYPKKL